MSRGRKSYEALSLLAGALLPADELLSELDVLEVLSGLLELLLSLLSLLGDRLAPDADL